MDFLLIRPIFALGGTCGDYAVRGVLARPYSALKAAVAAIPSATAVGALIAASAASASVDGRASAWLGALQTPGAAATSVVGEAPAVAFHRALTFAEVALQVARQRVCERKGRERRVAALYGRMRELVARARPAFGDIGEPLSIVESERGGPDCALFGRSAGEAVRQLDEAEAILASAGRGAD